MNYKNCLYIDSLRRTIKFFVLKCISHFQIVLHVLTLRVCELHKLNEKVIKNVKLITPLVLNLA